MTTPILGFWTFSKKNWTFFRRSHLLPVDIKNHKGTFRCKACNLDFETVSKLSNHNYDTHVNVQVNFDDESITIEKNNDKFQRSKCESKLGTATTLKRHIKKHNSVFKCTSKKKRQHSELESMDDEYPSINLNHRILENEEINLQVDTSNSFPSTLQVDKYTAILIASDTLSLSKKDQEKIITLRNIGNWKPIIILFMIDNFDTVSKSRLQGLQ
ncbi:unnamed protein product [Cunninghamella blakesleeana]